MSNSDYGFTFNGHHSSEFGLKVLSAKQVTLPAKRKTLVQLPYSSKQVDLSAVYGDNIYDERTVTFPCRLPYGRRDPTVMYAKIEEVTRWLYEPLTKSLLQDDAVPNYAFLGEVQAPPTVEESLDFCKITIVFQCYPYRLKKRFDDIWDTFNFETDVAQMIHVDVKGMDNFVLYNTGDIAVSLKVTTDSDNMLIALNSYNAIPLKRGDNESHELVLLKGRNTVTLVGTGHVDFDWSEEVI